MAVPGTVTVSARATDDVGVTKLELYNYGTLVASATTGSLSYSWNTANVANGSHALLSRAYDAARNVGTSSTVTVSNSGAGGPTTDRQPSIRKRFRQSRTVGRHFGCDHNDPTEPPHSGSWDAWLDEYGMVHTDTLSQQVTIPSNVTTATLTFWLHNRHSGNGEPSVRYAYSPASEPFWRCLDYSGHLFEPERARRIFPAVLQSDLVQRSDGEDHAHRNRGCEPANLVRG